MAEQMIYVSWHTDQGEKNITAASAAFSEEDIRLILSAVTLPVRQEPLPEDEDNETLAGIYCLDLPDNRIALAKSGVYYLSENDTPRGILHVLVEEKSEDFSPFLYVINNCFKNSLTEEEEKALQAGEALPAVSFPHPQFRLSQPEIHKFFSQGRRKTLINLVQAVIDSYDNRRIVIFNDKYPSLKYWFYGLHCCLPKNIKSRITLCSYAFEKVRDCKLICAAPSVDLQVAQDIEAGSFVIDNRGGISCEDIEAVKYTTSIVDVFLKNAEETAPILEGTERIMEEYHLPVSSAAGVYYLLEHDFAWFDSAHEIQYFLNKIGLADAAQLPWVADSLWREIKKSDFKFGCNESLLPVIAYIFRHTDETTKEDIRAFIDSHHQEIGVNDALSLREYYKEIVDKLFFLVEYLPTHLMETDTLDAYLAENINRADGLSGTNEICILMYMIADSYDKLTFTLGENAVWEACRKIMSALLTAEENAFLDICRKTASLPAEFAEKVIVPAIGKAITDEEFHPDDAFVFSVVREIADKSEAAAAIVAFYAEPGHYSETTLQEYSKVCSALPEETAAIDAVLRRKESHIGFLNEMDRLRFLSEPHASRNELEYFFSAIYLCDEEGSVIFEKRLQDYLDSLKPVHQIEEAGHFLMLLAASVDRLDSDSLARRLFEVIAKQSPLDIYDYYINNTDDFYKIYVLLSHVHPDLGLAFMAAGIGIRLRNYHTQPTEDDYRKLLLEIRSHADFAAVLLSGRFDKEWNQRFLPYLLAFMAEVAVKEADATDLFYRLLSPQWDSSFEKETVEFIFSSNVIQETEMLRLMTPYLLYLFRIKKQQSIAEQGFRQYLMTIPLKRKPKAFAVMLQCCHTGAEEAIMKQYLADFYYSTLSFWQKFRALPIKKLFSVQSHT